MRYNTITEKMFFTKYKVIVAVLLLCFLYTCFPVPFVLEDMFWNSLTFTVILTIGSCIILLSSIVNNALLITVLMNTPGVFGSINYLMIAMAVGDMLYPTFYLPFVVAHSWLLQQKSWVNIDFELLLEFSRFSMATYYFLAGASVTSFSFACAQRLYTTVVRVFDYVAFKVKFMLVCCAIICGCVLFVVNQKFTDAETWVHLLLSIVIIFLPTFFNLVCLLVTGLYRVFRQKYSNKRNLNYSGLYFIYLSYTVCWLPMFTVSSLHFYHTRLEFEHYSKLAYILPTLFVVKSPLNLFVLLGCDKRLSKQFQLIWNGLFSKKRRQKQLHNGWRGEMNNNNNVNCETPHTYSELKEFHLSASKIDMYTDSTADTKELIAEDV